MNRMPDELIDAMAFAATDRGGSITMLMGDNEIARLVLAWRNMSRRDSHLVEDAQTAIRTSEGVQRLKTENSSMRDYLEQREKTLEARVDRLSSEKELLRTALREAVYAMEDRDVFGDDPRITKAINTVNDVLRHTEPK